MQNIRKTYFEDRVSLIVRGFIAACVILLSLYFIVGYFAYRPYQKYRTAMEKGDGKSAVYYATKLFHQSERDFNKRKEKYGFSDSNRYNECYLYFNGTVHASGRFLTGGFHFRHSVFFWWLEGAP